MSECFKHQEQQGYEREVLGLQDDETEQTLDEQYLHNAKDLGIDLQPASPGNTISSCNSTTTVSTKPCRSDSIESRRSCSTGLTSNFSWSSKEIQFPPRLPLRLLSPFTPSVYEQEFDRASSHSSPNSRVSLSLLRDTLRSNSTPILPYASTRRPFSMIRGFSRLSKIRKSTSTNTITGAGPANCDSCPVGSLQSRPLHRLLCHHNLCRVHLRELVSNAMERATGTSPQCCGQAIPESLIEAVTDKQEQGILRLAFRQSQHTLIRRRYESLDAFLEARADSVSDERGRAISRGVQGRLRFDPMLQCRQEEAHRNLESALEIPEFKALRNRQEYERDQFLAFQSKVTTPLVDRHSVARREHVDGQSHALISLRDSHPADLATLEDRHVVAEMDLRASQEQEQRNCLVALRHMEAYGNGDERRIVTDQDRRQLERQYWLRDSLGQRHESAINVLREQQAKQMHIRALKLEAEITSLRESQEHDMRDFEKAFQAELSDLEEVFRQRKERLIKRWNLAIDIMRKRRDIEEKTNIPAPIASVEWPQVPADQARSSCL